MGNKIPQKTESKSYNFGAVIPLTRSQVRFKIKNKSKTQPFSQLEKASQFNPLQSIEKAAVELSFTSISDVSIECVEMYHNSTSGTSKALLLSVTGDDGKQNFHLIDLKDLMSERSNTEISDLIDQPKSYEDLYHLLSLREQKVLIEVSKGSTSNEIGRKFFISTNTVKNHRKNIKRKLNFDDNQNYSKFLKWSLEYSSNT